MLISYFCGSDSSGQVLAFNCDELFFETRPRFSFEFTGGACSSNDYYIMLCFSKQNKRRCYKSVSPTPEHWWQVTLTRMSNFEHDSTAISLSSYDPSGI